MTWCAAEAIPFRQDFTLIHIRIIIIQHDLSFNHQPRLFNGSLESIWLYHFSLMKKVLGHIFAKWSDDRQGFEFKWLKYSYLITGYLNKSRRGTNSLESVVRFLHLVKLERVVFRIDRSSSMSRLSSFYRLFIIIYGRLQWIE